jgi:hypothetical protein
MGNTAKQHELIIGDTIQLPELEGQSYDGLFDDYAWSVFGQHHQTQIPRFSKYYGYEPAKMIQDLGDDVDPLMHGLHTRVEIFEPLVYFQNVIAGSEVQKFNPREIAIGRLATQFHDIGECEHPHIEETLNFVVGDVARTVNGGKDEVTEKKEAKIRGLLFKVALPSLAASGLVPETEAVLTGGKSALASAAFDATELVGYYATGVKAAHLTLLETHHRKEGQPKRDDESYEQLMQLGHKVPVDWMPEILGTAADFPYLRYVLDRTVPYLDHIYREHGWSGIAA